MMTAESVPLELALARQWVVWKREDRHGHPTKVPYCALGGGKASVTDSRTWTTFENALKIGQDYDGIGYVFHPNGHDGPPIVGLDLDKALDSDGSIKPWAAEILARFRETYCEQSPSGRGLHFFFRAELPDGYKNRSAIPEDPDGGGLELYHHSRYFTITGQRAFDAPLAIAVKQESVDWLIRRFDLDRPSGAGKTLSCDAVSAPVVEDAEILRRARVARNGEKFLRLWTGDIQGYPSASEADAALLSILAHYTQDPAQLQRLFLASKLGEREKAKRADYLEGTIAFVLQGAASRSKAGLQSKSALVNPSAAQTPQEALGLLNCASIWESQVRWASFKRFGGTILGTTETGLQVRFETSRLLDYRHVQQRLLEYLHIGLIPPKRGSVGAMMAATASLIMRATEAESPLDSGQVEDDIRDLLQRNFRLAGRPTPETRAQWLQVLDTLATYDRRLYAETTPPAVIVWQESAWVHPGVLRTWAGTPAGDNLRMSLPALREMLGLLRFRPDRAEERDSLGQRSRLRLWRGPQEVLDEN